VTLDAGADSIICLTDAVTLKPQGDGLYFKWKEFTPVTTLNNSLIKNPIATPRATSVYEVTASIGKCNATDQVTIITVPYPGSNAGRDTVICYEDTAQIVGSIKGASFNWSPVNTLINAASLNPQAFPLRTTSYVLTVYDYIGCPKPKRDTVIVTVRPKILTSAGHDTAIVVGQPLQLTGRGAEFFSWSPPTGLNRTNVQSPIATLTENNSYVLKAYTAEGCYNLDTINVKVFKTHPDIFVPNGFTPDRQTNNLFRPIPVGITKIQVFYVYNRWGQLLYSNTDASRGWDGRFAGKPQPAGTYVWTVTGTDYTGKQIFKKGTMVLIR
jgi:gliding motility-associated-like protein